MKLLLSSFIVLALQSSAFAQSTSAVTAPVTAASETGGPVAAATSTASAPTSSTFNVKYVGIYEGPAFDANAGGTTMNGDPQAISNRAAIQYSISKVANTGFQARISTIFDATNGLIAISENHRFFGNLKNVASYGILNLNLTGKAILPTSNRAHNLKMSMGSEFTPTLEISPANSRFSFSYAPQMQKYFYENSSSALSARGIDFYIVNNLEGTYQLGTTTQITMGLYPEYFSQNKSTFTNRSNELDVGMNWDFAKGWSANPYIGAQLNGFDIAKAGKNMEIALTVSGTLL